MLSAQKVSSMFSQNRSNKENIHNTIDEEAKGTQDKQAPKV